VGLWQLSIAGLNFFNNGAYKATAQIMQAVLMGGAIHHHAVGENQPAASVGALAFLGAAALVTASGVCRRWRSLLDERPAVWEGALFELDPCAVLGPAGFAAALGAGKAPLRVVHALGDSRCGKCRRRGARYFAPVAARRACGEWCIPSSDETALTLLNRFFFLRADEPGAMRVSTRDELIAAVKACKTRDPESCDLHLNTVVLTCDIDLGGSSDAPFLHMLKLCGQPGLKRKPRLVSSNSGFFAIGVVLEDLHLEVGMPWEEWYEQHCDEDGDIDVSEMAHFPALETGAFMPVIARNCVVHCNVGSAVMLNGRGAVSLHGCAVVSQTYFGVIAKPDALAGAAADAPQFKLSVRGCSFTESSWHIAVCFELTAADTAALRDGNTCSSSAGADDVVDVNTGPSAPGDVALKLQGCVQPGMIPAIDAATARVLDAVGVQSVVATRSGCCGAIRHHLDVNLNDDPELQSSFAEALRKSLFRKICG
jgi:hypothetical protein